MKKILFALAEYYPKPSATTHVIQFLLKHLYNKGYDVHVLLIRPDRQLPLSEDIDGIHVHRFSLKFAEALNSRKNIFYRMVRRILINSKWNRKYRDTGIDFFERNGIQKAFNKLVSKEKYDTVVSVSYPLVTQFISCEAKRKYPLLRWVAYEIDPFAYNFAMVKQMLTVRKQWELQCYQNSDVIISSWGIQEYNDSQGYRKEFAHKTKSVCLPGISENNIDDLSLSIIEYDSRKTNFVFAGVFYKSIRSPLPFFKLLENEYDNSVFHIIRGDISMFDLSDDVLKTVKSYQNCNKEACDASILSADIAVNLDNNVPNQIPSKLLNYMSLGVPILNLYYPNCTLGEECLKEYEPHLSICVSDVDTEEARNKLKEFIAEIRKNGKKRYKPNIPLRMQNDYVCSQLEEIICGDITEN